MTTVAEMATYQERVEAMRRAGMWTPDEASRFDALRSSGYVLVRNDGDERWKCGRRDPDTGKWVDGCGAKHDFFTLRCTPRPFKGLLHGLYAYWANVGGARESDLSPGQRQRLDVLRPIFGDTVPVLASGHPSMAAGLETADRDVLVGATVLGSIEPISRTKARIYIEIINSRAGHRALVL